MYKPIGQLEAFTKKANVVLSVICGILLIVLAGLLFLNIFTRAFNIPIYGLALLSVFVVMMAFYLGLSRCEEVDEHVKVEVFTSKLPLKVKNIVVFLTYLLQIFIYGIALYAFSKNAIHSYQSKEAVVGNVVYLVWPAKFVIVVGLAFYWLQLLVNMMKKSRDL